MRWLDDDRRAGITFIAGLALAGWFAATQPDQLSTAWVLLIVALLGIPIIARAERRRRDGRPDENDPRVPGDHDLLPPPGRVVDPRQDDVT